MLCCSFFVVTFLQLRIIYDSWTAYCYAICFSEDANTFCKLYVLGPKFFFDPKIFWTYNLLGLFFCAKNLFNPYFCWNQIFCTQQFVDPRFCWSKNFFWTIFVIKGPSFQNWLIECESWFNFMTMSRTWVVLPLPSFP